MISASENGFCVEYLALKVIKHLPEFASAKYLCEFWPRVIASEKVAYSIKIYLTVIKAICKGEINNYRIFIDLNWYTQLLNFEQILKIPVHRWWHCQHTNGWSRTPSSRAPATLQRVVCARSEQTFLQPAAGPAKKMYLDIFNNNNLSVDLGSYTITYSCHAQICKQFLQS